MCDLDLNTPEDTKKWILKNHPDKGGQVDSIIFKDVIDCYKTRSHCDETDGQQKKTQPLPKKGVVGGLPLKIFTCIRQTENWSKILPTHKIDNKSFDPEAVKAAIHHASPKLEQLFRIIEQVDANDLATHGQYFKHFIFSDVKEGGYGAKILAAAFVASGYKNLIAAQKVPNQKATKLTLLPTGAEGENKSFGLLSSSAIFNSEFNQKFKKAVLTKYNKRPENINGADMRFIILDSGFKEGIDLFDVKYVHIFETSMTIADLKQTIGRATRTCGQKGLNFEPMVGWPLFVYNYYIAVPEDIKELYEAADPSLLKDDDDKKIFKNAKKLSDVAVLYSNYDKTLTNLAEQLYKLAPIFSVDFALTKSIHRIDDMAYLYEIQNDLIEGGAGTGKDAVKCAGKCGRRSTKDIPATVKFLATVYHNYDHDKTKVPRKEPRKYFCEYMKKNADYCAQLNAEWANRASLVPKLMRRETINKTKTLNKTVKTKSVKTKKTKSVKTKSIQRAASPLKIANEVMQELDLVPYRPPTEEMDYSIIAYTGKTNARMKQAKIGPPTSKLNFLRMRDFIKTNYVKDFTWGEMVIENKCVSKEEQAQAQQAQTQQPQQAQAQQALVGGASRIMSLNPTQDFVRTFFTPESPYKGLLLWHSVGCGKTCTAIATATSSFEQEGYTILWVTRNTLKIDVYKNMFDDVCHIILAERMKAKNLKIPEDPSKRKRLLSKNWIEPISYKTFSNLLTPGAHNVYMDKLIQRNGKADILRKTLIIIDEAHKLYGGDLKAAERPNMDVMEQLLQKSYRVSGQDSARLLIMTATPFTNSPMELFQLINLCKEDESEKIPTDIAEFKKTYMNNDNLLRDTGVKNLADKLSGYISYLNREQDPTQFAQPIMIEVPVIMSHIEDPELRKEYFLANADKDDKKAHKTKETEIKNFKKEQERIIKDLKKRLRETQSKSKAEKKKRQARCKSIKNREEKARCLEREDEDPAIEELIETIQEEIANLEKVQSEQPGIKKKDKAQIAQMKEKLDTLRNELLQEVMLKERCKSLKFIGA